MTQQTKLYDQFLEIAAPGCAIRPYRLEDVRDLAHHANNPRVAKNLRDRFPQPYGEDDAKAWISASLSQSPLTNFAITEHDAVIGSIGVTLRDDVHRRSAEIGYWIGEERWGRGIATAAVRTFTRYAMATYNLLRLDACVFAWNPSSAKVLEKAGYAREGVLRRAGVKNGQTLDLWLYAITIDEL